MSDTSKTALIIGPGGVGSVLALELARQGFQVSFVGRQGPIAHHFELQYGEEIERFEAPIPGQADLLSPLVFVTVKAFDLEAALQNHLPLLNPDAVVIPMGNGFVQQELEAAAKAHPDTKFRLGISTFGVTSVSKGVYSLRAPGVFRWGALIPADDTPTPAEKLLLRDSRVFQWLDDAPMAARKKWLFNTVLNSISAADRLPNNGAALVSNRLALVFREAFHLGVELWGPWNDTEDALFRELRHLASLTAQNENSAAQDVRLGRRTETDFLAGLARGRKNYPELDRLDRALRLN